MKMIRNITKVPMYVSNLKTKVKFPSRFKGTIVEKWADYWKNLFIDYKQMLLDLRSDIQEEPRKAFIWIGSLATMYTLAKNNPDELEFRDVLRRISNKMVMVSEPCRNQISTEHLNFIETCYNQGVIHYKNLGVASIMYTSELSGGCDLYKTQCKYLQPSFFTFPSRIVDVGIMGRWWNLYKKTANYDVNNNIENNNV